jgi:hypothetical protein
MSPSAGEQARAALQRGRHHFAPVRHHSPACSWMVAAMIRELRPDLVLIEMPSDLARFADLLADADTVPPIAVVALADAEESGEADADSAKDAADGGKPAPKPRRSLYYPFARHSPEFVAIRAAQAIGAGIRFIDLPVGLRTPRPGASPGLSSERPFDSADFVAALRQRLGLRDGGEVWDHLFETRLGGGDWRAFFADVHAYCAGLRETTDPDTLAHDDTLAREAAMRWHLAEAAGQSAVVVTGGFHTPALLDTGEAAAPPPIAAALPIESYLVRYSEDALDKASGYGAGLRFPLWYDRLWMQAVEVGGPPDWRAAALEAGLGFARVSAAAGRRIALPQIVELVAMAEGLARFKGRDAVLVSDLLDGVRTALVKTEAGPGEPYTDAMLAWLTGARIGEVPRRAGQPPIIGDARRRAKAARIDLSESLRKPKTLDIRRDPAHREASRFLHQMALLKAGFGQLESGPDFVAGRRTDLLFEEWRVGWSPFVEGRLIEVAALGATVQEAATAALAAESARLAERGQDDLAARLGLLLAGLRAGLGAALADLARDLLEATARSTSLPALAEVVARLAGVGHGDDPLHDPAAPPLGPILTAAHDSALITIPDLATATDEAITDAIAALRRLDAAMRGPFAARFSPVRFADALAGLSARRPPPRLHGAVLALLVHGGHRPPSVLAAALGGAIAGVGSAADERARLLDGLISAAPMLLWRHREVLAAAETALAGLDEAQFLAALPALRRALTQLDPHETDRLADEVADLLGAAGADVRLQSHAYSAADATRALGVDQALGRVLAADGLPDWGEG